MAKLRKLQNQSVTGLKWPLLLTWFGMLAERMVLAFWPLTAIVLLTLAVLMLGGHLFLPLEIIWAGGVLAGVAGLLGLGFGLWRFRFPTRDQALARIDETLPNRPIAAVMDTLAMGAGDDASREIWDVHVAQMAKRVRAAQYVAPDIQTRQNDPFALRYVALLIFAISAIFGSFWHLTDVDGFTLNGSGNGASASWEGWAEPPTYTGKPTIYLPDIAAGGLKLPVGSMLTLRLYGDVGDVTVTETVSQRTTGLGSVAQANQSFQVTRSGNLKIDGPSGRSWDIVAIEDEFPAVQLAGPIEHSARGEMKLPFRASDDHGVTGGEIRISLDIASVPRQFGLTAEPEPQNDMFLDLPIPFRANRQQFEDVLIEDLAQHPWAGLPVLLEMSATDALDQTGRADPAQVILPGRTFFDPLAAALVEQRRYLLWSRQNAKPVAQVLRAVSHRPDDVFPSGSDYLKLRVAVRRLDAGVIDGALNSELRDEIAAALWDMALTLEDGDLADARARLERAQDQLEQAMRDGATDEEIAELMQELNDAMQDYLRQLAEEQQENPNQAVENQDTPEITSQQLQDMLDEIQELMEQGRMAEAQQLMEELRQLMENMQVTQGEGDQSPGQQSMQDLAETLRQQQELSDETFQELQDRFGEQNGEPEQPGEDGSQGQQGESDGEGDNAEPGQGTQGGNQGQMPGQDGSRGTGQQPGDGEGRGAGNSPQQGLAERQQALRDQLNRQSRELPGETGQSGSGTRQSLGRAEGAMDGAEQALRQRDFAGALDEQGRALEALREGMRELADDIAQQQNARAGQQGNAAGGSLAETNRDPLGRDAGAIGQIGSDQNLLQGQDVYRRAQELLEEIRRRSSDQQRPNIELDYLRRLLDRF